MKIISRNENTYEVKWKPAGWSYAEAHVFVRVKFLWTTRLKHLWVGTSRSLLRAEKMFPDEMKRWFEESVQEYENYQLSWKNYEEE